MGRKKRLAKLVDTVQGILGTSVKAKKLRKSKALRSFIEAMEKKKIELQAELSSPGIVEERQEIVERHVHTLEKQIRKATKMLIEVDSANVTD